MYGEVNLAMILQGRTTGQHTLAHQARKKVLASEAPSREIVEQVSVVAVSRIESCFELIEVQRQIFQADVVIRPYDPALEQGPEAFYAVAMDVPVHVALYVLHNLVRVSMPRERAVGYQFVRVDLRPWGGVILEERNQSPAGHFPEYTSADPAAALQHASDGNLRRAAPPHPALAALLVSRLLSRVKVGLVGLKDARESHNKLILAHRRADAMQEVPRRAVRHVDMPLKLASAHALLARSNEVKGQEPFRERKMRTMHHGSRRSGELLAATVALVLTSIRKVADALRAANWALDPIGPADVC